jgi:site-specific DNA-methyltransferase (adenine-specific)
MGNTWDGGDIAFKTKTWLAFKKVMYPGAFGMAFSGSRSWHRMAIAIERAGFVIHPTIFLWAYGAGLPKATRVKDSPAFEGHRYGLQALKPAVEPIIVFQKPYAGRPLDNIYSTGAGTLNIEAGRVGDAAVKINRWTDDAHPFGGGAGNEYESVDSKGRWPANFILDQDTAQALDQQTGELTSGDPAGVRHAQNQNVYGKVKLGKPITGYGDSGGASRFFYNVQADLDAADPVLYYGKATAAEREAGLESMEKRAFMQSGGGQSALSRGETEYMSTGRIGLNKVKQVANPHPTVKRLDLCRHLAALLLPPGIYAPRRLFVPFAGVASECIGGHLAGWDEVDGVESDTENGYIEVAEKRIKYWTSKPVALDLFTGKGV